MEKLFSTIIYENPLPQLRSRQSAFPGLCVLPSGKILAAHQIGEAFESVDGTTYISVSDDGGRSFSKPRRVFDKSNEKVVLNDNGKPTLLPDGRIAILGYMFYRDDPELPIGNPETGGLLPDEAFIAFSNDGGESFGERMVIKTSFGNSVEASAPLTLLADGSIAAPITGFADWDGVMKHRNCGRLLRSFDGGKTFEDSVVCTAFEGDGVTCFEQRMCQTEDGTIVVISWNENLKTGERMNNHITISTDNGKSFSAPIDTRIHGQASSIISLGENRVMTIHAVRRDTEEPGIYAAIADISGGKWKLESIERIWKPDTPVTKDKHMAEIFAYMKFGQPNGIITDDGKLLLCHWECKNGQYRTLLHAYRI